MSPGRGAALTRRGLLLGGTAALASLACGSAPRRAPAGGPETAASALPEPPVLAARDGVLTATLQAGRVTVPVPGPEGTSMIATRVYNGHLPGPTLRLLPGDLLDLELVNALPPLAPCGDEQEDDENAPHGFDVTNLHTHGLHVSPQSLYPGGGTEPAHPGQLPVAASDDVMLTLGPGQRQRYRIQLPDFHAPGTHWYHAHKHGAAAFQVGNGMVGALIVDEPPGERLVPPESDRVWVLHEGAGDEAAELYTLNAPLPRLLVNGTRRPRVRLAPGAVERWRFVNATASLGGFLRLRLIDEAGAPRPFALIAVDGISFYGRLPQPRDEWVLPPGGRADLLVTLSERGRYRLIREAVADSPASFKEELASVEVDGRRVDGSRGVLTRPLPGRRPEYLRPIVTASPAAGVAFGVEPGPVRPPGPCGRIDRRFTIDAQPYRRDRIDREIRFGAVEEWALSNHSSAVHAFHIHVNPFQVVGEKVDPAAADEPDNWLWRDVVAVPPTTPDDGPVKIRSRFVDYSGRFVLHCHVLVHEDLGMMQNVLVGPGGAVPGARLPKPIESFRD